MEYESNIGHTFVNVHPLHPGHGTSFHDSVWHCDGVDSVHDTLEENTHIINVKLCYKPKFQKHTSLNVQYKLLHSISPLRRHATSPYPSCSPTHLRASPLKQKTQKHK